MTRKRPIADENTESVAHDSRLHGIVHDGNTFFCVTTNTVNKNPELDTRNLLNPYQHATYLPAGQAISLKERTKDKIGKREQSFSLAECLSGINTETFADILAFV